MTTQPTGASAAVPGPSRSPAWTKSYRSTPALRDYNLSLESGHIVGLMGPNGCGKTTLLKILAESSDYEGTVTIDGHAPGVATKEIVSYLPDADYLNPEWTAVDAIRIYLHVLRRLRRRQSLLDGRLLRTAHRPTPGEMSKGMGEKLQISLVMSRRARVFLLDEPISGVDPATRDVILEGILREFDPASLLIMSTHLISDIEHFVDYALFMKDGQVFLRGDADDLRAAHGDSLDAIFRKEYRWADVHQAACLRDPRFRADARSFASSSLLSRLPRESSPRGSAAPPLSSPTPCVRSRRPPARSRPWPTTGRPSTAARLLHDEPADLRKGRLLGEEHPHHDRVPPGARTGPSAASSPSLRPPRGATVSASRHTAGPRSSRPEFPPSPWPS